MVSGELINGIPDPPIVSCITNNLFDFRIPPIPSGITNNHFHLHCNLSTT